MSKNNTDETLVSQADPASRENAFIDFKELLKRVPICDRSLREWTRRGKIPSIKLPHNRKYLYHWPSVQACLLRNQIGGANWLEGH